MAIRAGALVDAADLAAIRPLNGVTSGTTDANGNLGINHTLGVTPTTVVCGARGWAALYANPHGSRTSTSFHVHVSTATGANAASTAVTIEWVIYP